MTEQTKTLEKTLLDISKFTFQNYKKLKHIGVLCGNSGVALFQFNCASYFNDDSYSNKGAEILEHCVEKLNSGYSLSTYCNGIAGFGWTLLYLYENEFIEFNIDELLNPFDDYLIAKMRGDLSKGYYDVLHGGLGYGFYFLKRYKNAQSTTNKEKYLTLLKETMDYLMESSIVEGECIKWKSILDPDKGTMGYNLSLSHGISSIINYLSRLNNIQELKKSSESLLIGAVNYVISHQNKSPIYYSLFPSWIEENVNPKYNSRMAWCYGDLGIAVSLLKAGKSLDDANIIRESLAIINKTLKRRDFEDTLVMDAALCHGSFGIAQVYKQFNQNKDLNEHVAFWMENGLEKAEKQKQNLFLSYYASEKKFIKQTNLLEGMSGIGLSILDSLSNQKNNWDECLMLSDSL